MYVHWFIYVEDSPLSIGKSLHMWVEDVRLRACSVLQLQGWQQGGCWTRAIYVCYLWFEVLLMMRSGRALGRNEPLQLHARTLLSLNVPSVLWGWNQPSYSSRCWWKASLFPSIPEPGLHSCTPLQRHIPSLIRRRDIILGKQVPITKVFLWSCVLALTAITCPWTRFSLDASQLQLYITGSRVSETPAWWAQHTF